MVSMKDKRIAVLLGGISKERDISLKSGKAVSKGLRDKGYDVFEIDAGLDLPQKLKDSGAGAAFVILHGRFGEDGSVQGLLECMKIPYTGSGILGSALSMNKALSKKIFSKEDIATADYLVFEGQGDLINIRESIEKAFDYPVVVKPSCEGSTIGLSVARDRDEIDKALRLAFDHDPEIVVERFIEGTEVTVGVLEDKPLPLVEIAPKEGHFDYRSKYTKGMTDYYVPARVRKPVEEKCRELGARAFRALQCKSFGRIDMMVDRKGDPYVLEVNSIPGMTETSLIPKAAKEIGIDFPELVEKILLGACLKIKA